MALWITAPSPPVDGVDGDGDRFQKSTNEKSKTKSTSKTLYMSAGQTKSK